MIEPLASMQPEAGLLPENPVSESEGLAAHSVRYGPPPLEPEDAIQVIESSGLTGRGGAAFPAGVKWRSVAAQASGRAVVLVNGVEADPSSGKDRLLMATRPHLVLDGAVMAARSLGAREVLIGVNRRATEAHRAMAAAIRERRERLRLELVDVPPRYVAGEETALVQFVSGGPARPKLTPPRPFERGVRGQPTLVHNAETLAWVALIGRHGAAWYRALGSDRHPGAMLVTIRGAVSRPGVYELPCSMSAGEALAQAGVTDAQALLLGGYFGTWVATEGASVPLGSIPGVILALAAGSCGLTETARIMSFLAGESARQCGPCFNGLPALSSAVGRVAAGSARPAEVERLRRWANQLSGHRGACHHPDGAVNLLKSALRTFEADLDHHLRRGACRGSRQPSILPAAAAEDGWR
jgi:NADH:ubiquinone oxidoreductase subunit F (NADH-binding)